jgi:two-component system, sensor histidine kinase RpfC
MSFETDADRKAGRLRRYGMLLRRRLRSRPDTEHEMMLNRLAIVTVALGYLWIASYFGSADAGDAFQKGIILCAVYAICSVVLLGHIIYQPGISHVRRSIALVMDMVVLSTGMYLGDAAFALGYPIYLWIIFGNGFRFGVRYLAASALAAVVGFSCVIMTTPIWIRDIDLSLGLMVGLVLLPAYVAALIRKLSEAKRQAEEASKVKSMFLASVSHELRTPLNAIITLSDLLEPQQTKREPREMVQTIATSGRSLLKMINSILDLSRIEAGTSMQVSEDFNLHGLLAQVRRVLSVQARAKGLELGVWIGPGVPVMINGAEQDLEEILINLIGNAIKFTRHGGVWVSVELAGEALDIRVRDTGIGIEGGAQQRIFESFVQADASITDRFGGTGLGLSIVKQLVERNGGLITVESQVGAGSTFRFSFALVAAQIGAAQQPIAWPAIVVTRNLALEALLRLHHVDVTRLASLEQLQAEVRRWADREAKQVVIIDVDTLSPRELASQERLFSQMLADALVGVLSAGHDHPGMFKALPFAVALRHPVSADALDAFGALSRPFADDFDPEAVHDVCARPLSILAAEDNITNQKVLIKLLGRDGHEVHMVDNGEKAVEALTKADYDLVLMDINMPVMNGLDATKLHRFASLGRARTPIYALTADVTPETRKACADAGMDGCLHKPIEQQELQTVLMSISGRRSVVPALQGLPKAEIAAEPVAAPEDKPLDLDQTPLADHNTLASLHGLGGADFVADLMAQFTSDALGQIDLLRQSVEKIDSVAFRDIAHSLRSSAANVGARRMFALCLDWRNISTEEVARDGDQRISQLLAELENTQLAMAAWLDQRSLDGVSARKTA